MALYTSPVTITKPGTYRGLNVDATGYDVGILIRAPKVVLVKPVVRNAKRGGIACEGRYAHIHSVLMERPAVSNCGGFGYHVIGQTHGASGITIHRGTAMDCGLTEHSHGFSSIPSGSVYLPSLFTQDATTGEWAVKVGHSAIMPPDRVFTGGASGYGRELAADEFRTEGGWLYLTTQPTERVRAISSNCTDLNWIECEVYRQKDIPNADNIAGEGNAFQFDSTTSRSLIYDCYAEGCIGYAYQSLMGADNSIIGCKEKDNMLSANHTYSYKVDMFSRNCVIADSSGEREPRIDEAAVNTIVSNFRVNA